MTSSRFSRRPRVQPTPKVCGVPPPPLPPPVPSTLMTAIINWDYPGPPPPPFSCHETIHMPWIPASNWWRGHTTPAVDEVQAWFHLFLPSGAAYAYLQAFRNGVNIFAAASYDILLEPGQPIDLTIDTWIGLTPSHVLTAHFTCNLYP